MKNSLNDLLRERFQGHEAPVDPGTWAVIEAKLLTAAPASDPVNDLFRERFQGHESAVDPSAWSGISNRLGHPVSGAGWSGLYGWMAAGVAGVVAIGALVMTLGGKPVETAVAAPVETDELPEPVAVAEVGIVSQQVDAKVLEPAVPKVRQAAPKAIPSPQDEHVTTVPKVTEPLAQAPEEAVVVDRIIEDLTVRTMLDVLTSDERPDPKTSTNDQSLDGDERGDRYEQEVVAPIVEESIKLFMPNTFTPNGDGINDTYRILPRTGFERVVVRVYSMKNNQLVFSSTSIDEEWQGLNCDDGMYLVAVEAQLPDGHVLADGKVVWLNRIGTN
ncbi:MAG: gliding motility-associated C-terminal domain-containing protein [Flavobacteriales bacterium]|nr:gliding motility-associated C-terminal domain-containing protein [Flavobacteriales bacterium]